MKRFYRRRGWDRPCGLLGESLGAASCVFYEHDQENWPGRLPSSTGHEVFDDLWARNQISAPDPHVGVYLQKCNAFIKAGYTSAIEHQFSTEEERRTLPYYWETARAANRDWLALAYFSVEGRAWCLTLYRGDDEGPFTPEDAQLIGGVGPYVAKIVSLARKFAAFDVASKSLNT